MRSFDHVHSRVLSDESVEDFGCCDDRVHCHVHGGVTNCQVHHFELVVSAEESEAVVEFGVAGSTVWEFSEESNIKSFARNRFDQKRDIVIDFERHIGEFVSSNSSEDFVEVFFEFIEISKCKLEM